MFIWPLLHATLVAFVTSWDMLPANSKVYDYLPSSFRDRAGPNGTSLTSMTKELLSEWWRGEPEFNPNVALTWVNGINYTTADVEDQAMMLSTLFGCKVRPYYNPSLGHWLKDLTRVSYMYVRSPVTDPVVTGLANHLHMVLEEVGPRGRVVHIAHSGGALLTYLVAKYHLKEEERRRIDVINFGGAWSITKKYFNRAVNYYARNDPILFVNKRAATLMMKVLREKDKEVMYLKHNTSFVFLHGRAQSMLADHSLIGPTYMEALHREAQVFRELYSRNLLSSVRITKPYNMTWTRYFRKRAAAATGVHGFFSRRLPAYMPSWRFKMPIANFSSWSLSSWTLPQGLRSTTSLYERLRPWRKYFARLTGRRHYFQRTIKPPAATDVQMPLPASAPPVLRPPGEVDELEERTVSSFLEENEEHVDVWAIKDMVTRFDGKGG